MLADAATLSALVPSLLIVWALQTVRARSRRGATAWIVFLLGFLAAFGILLVADPLIRWLKGLSDPHLRALGGAYLLAAVPEESLKFLVLLVAVIPRGRIRTPMDGLVFGVAASLGFASLENLLFAQRGGLETSLPRLFTAVPCHAFLGVIMGRFVAEAVLIPARRFAALSLAWVLPVALHGLYDYALLVLTLLGRAGSPDAALWHLAAGGLLALILVGGSLWAYQTVRAAREPVTRRGPAFVPPPRLAEAGAVLRSWLFLLVGGALSSLGSWVLLGISLTSYRGAAFSPAVERALLGLLIGGAALLLFGLAFFARGIRIRRRFQQAAEPPLARLKTLRRLSGPPGDSRARKSGDAPR